MGERRKGTQSGAKEEPKKSAKTRRGGRRHARGKAQDKAKAAKSTLLKDDEGTPLFEEESFKRPKGPVTPAEPVVIEIPKAKPTENKKKRDKSKAKMKKKKEPEKPAVEKPDEMAPEIEGVRVSEVPREFPVNIDQRIGIFVDVQNMFYTAKHKYNRKIDYRKLIEAVARKRRVIRALAYMVQAPEIDQSQFKHILEELGFELRIKDLRIRADGTAKGDWDMGIAIDTISMRDKLDVVALVSGDGDFTELVHMLRSSGIRVEVYGFPSNTADDLKRAATFYYPMDEGFLMKW
jgi:uncharacterized LabA/DUF88 family protein